MNTIGIDTSNHILSIAIMNDDGLVGELTTNLKVNHSERLLPAIHDLMDTIDMSPSSLEKVVVAKGPGSYTGVRIGLTTAKSLAWTLDIPIVGVSSLEALAYQGRLSTYRICPFFDARRQRVYTGLYEWKKDRMVLLKQEQNIDMEKWLSYLAEKKEKVLFLSPHISLYEKMIVDYLGDLAVIPETPYHVNSASHLILASKYKSFDDVHTLVPNYLRLAEAEAKWLKAKEHTSTNE